MGEHGALCVDTESKCTQPSCSQASKGGTRSSLARVGTRLRQSAISINPRKSRSSPESIRGELGKQTATQTNYPGVKGRRRRYLLTCQDFQDVLLLEKSKLKSSLVVQQVKDQASSLLWLRFDPWPRNFCMLRGWQKKNRTKLKQTTTNRAS